MLRRILRWLLPKKHSIPKLKRRRRRPLYERPSFTIAEKRKYYEDKERRRRLQFYWHHLYSCRRAIVFYVYFLLIFVGELLMRLPPCYGIVEYIEVIIILSCLFGIGQKCYACFVLHIETDNFMRGEPKETPCKVMPRKKRMFYPGTIKKQKFYVVPKKIPVDPKIKAFELIKEERRHTEDGCFETVEEYYKYIRTMARKELKEIRSQEYLEAVRKEYASFRILSIYDYGPLPYSTACDYPIPENIRETEENRQLVTKLKLWMCNFLLKRLNEELDLLDKQLQAANSAYRVDYISLSTMKKLADDKEFRTKFAPSLQYILKFLDLSPTSSTPYVINRIRNMQREFLLYPFEDTYFIPTTYSEQQPSDNYIIFHLFSVFMDLEMGASVSGARKPFSSRYMLLNDGEDSPSLIERMNRTSFGIYCSNRINPKFCFILDGIWTQYPQPEGFCRVLVDFLREIYENLDNRLDRFNMEFITSWVFNKPRFE